MDPRPPGEVHAHHVDQNGRKRENNAYPEDPAMMRTFPIRSFLLGPVVMRLVVPATVRAHLFQCLLEPNSNALGSAPS
jgi:hypothetical protein